MHWIQGPAIALALLAGHAASGQTGTVVPPAAVTFRTGVDKVMVSAVVRDHAGKLVTDLLQSDFEVLDNGERRPITDFRADRAAVSVALLFDGSGSMQVAEKIVQVDQKAAAGNAAASEAAATARTTADRAAEKAAAVEVATKRIIYEETISEDQGNFKLNQTALPVEAKTRIDEMVNQMKATPNGAYIEVAGYTDNTGEKAYNEKLGLERAETVKRYLYQQHQIPLHRISVISYGSEKPVAPNTTRAGRALNRRVVIRVLE